MFSPAPVPGTLRVIVVNFHLPTSNYQWPLVRELAFGRWRLELDAVSLF
jgi:hypothetical protein